MGHIPENEDPFEGNSKVPQQGTRLNIDGQTNAESSQFKTRLQTEIKEGDAKLGQEITRQGEELGGEIAENSSKIEKVAGEIEGITDGIASSIDNIEKDLKFLTGDKESEFTAEEIKADIEVYLTEQAEAIKIIKAGDGATPGEAEYARLWLSNFGETYSAIHFLAWKLKDFSNVVDDLDSSQMEQYNQHVEKLRKQLVHLYAELEKTDVNKPEYAELEDKITDIVQQFVRITDEDELYPEEVTKRIATLEKGIQYFFDIDTNAFEEFQEILETRALGIGVNGNTEFTGAYYRELHAEFSAKAEEMRAILDMAQKADEDGVELEDEDMFNIEKAMWFRNTFTLTSTLAAVFSYDDWRDRLNQVDFDEGVYSKYVEYIDMLKQLLSKFQGALSGIDPDDPARAKYEDEITRIEEELSSYTCDTEEDEYSKCQAGHFAWYLNQHDTNEDAYRVATNEEIGLNPAESVVDLDVNKTVFRLVTEEALAILKSPIGSHPESVIEAARAHINRFGKDSNSTVAYSEWQNYVLETNVSDAVGEILNASDCISERLVSEINEAVDNVSIEEALIFPFPDGNRTSFNIVVEGQYKIILVTLNGLIQNGFVGQRGELEFDFAPALGSQISVLVEKTTNVNLNTPVVDDCEFSIDDILKKGTYKCSESRRAIVKLRRILDSTRYNVDESKESKEVKQAFVNELTAAIEGYTKAIDEADANINTLNSEIKKLMEKLKSLQSDYDVSITDLSEKNEKLDDVQKDIISNESNIAEANNTIKLNETLKAAEEARPFPDESVLDMYNQNIEDAKKDREELDAVLAENRDIEKTLKSDISDLEKEVSGLDADISETTTSVDERMSDLASNKTTKSASENNKAFASDVKAESESLIEKLDSIIDELNQSQANLESKLKSAEEAAEQFCSSAESVKNLTSRSANVDDVIGKTYGKVYEAIIGEEPREVKTTGYFNIGVVGDGPKAIATNPPEFELMDENLDIKALNEDGTEMEP